NLVGHGIDNHLCALLVLARQSVESGEIEKLPDIFQDPLWTEVLRFPLSTSQVTTSPDIPNCYLCYGAVVRDGYGCSYNLQNDTIIFAPSAFKSNPRTNLAAFKDSIRSSLYDMRSLLTDNQTSVATHPQLENINNKLQIVMVHTAGGGGK
ncbi:hypothetical protein TELCIR_16455, partial [Teladorsagia circumcincta]